MSKATTAGAPRGLLTAWMVGREPVLSPEQASAVLDAAGLPIAAGMCRRVLVQMVASEAIFSLHQAFALAERQPPVPRRGRPRNRLHDRVVPRVAALFELAFGQPAKPGTSADGATGNRHGPFVRVLIAFFRAMAEGVPRERLPPGVARLWVAPQSIGAAREAARDPTPRGKNAAQGGPRRRRLGTAEEEREAAVTEWARWPEWLQTKAAFGHLAALRAEYAAATGQPWPPVVVTVRPGVN